MVRLKGTWRVAFHKACTSVKRHWLQPLEMHLNQSMPRRRIWGWEWVTCCILASQILGLRSAKEGTQLRVLGGQNHSWRATMAACAPTCCGFCLVLCVLISLCVCSVLSPWPRPSSTWLLSTGILCARNRKEFNWPSVCQASVQVTTSLQGTFV